MTKKIFRSILLAAGIVLAAGFVLITGFMNSYFGGLQQKQLKNELGVASAALELAGREYLEALGSNEYRFTWIADDGTVLYDTQADADVMENHGGREEVREALDLGVGESTRYSATLLEKTMYYARRLQDGTVLRISVSSATVGVLLLGMLQPLLVVFVLALILSIVLAKRLAKRIVEPLNRLDLEKPLENDAYEELAPLLGRINTQHRQIAGQLNRLKQKTEEFEQITSCMTEGLVLLDNKNRVLSINPAARRLLVVEGACVGQDFSAVDRSREMSQAIEKALSEGHAEITAARQGRRYQVDVSRIESEGEAMGVVLLAFDVTEREDAERRRREFTANVSHELKTPLQSIIGGAELIENGLVKPEDMPRFVGHIRKEAARLVALIEDIIRLSQLDEGVQMPREQTDVLETAREVVSSLQDSALQKKLRLSLSGEGGTVWGVRRLVHEILFNLCENAIKYNVEGGAVELRVWTEDETVCISVQDTGIGIPPEHQPRVFERFYRVDKSHSKASGGTGLGLSIVKHAVQLSHGTISLRSEPGQGTQVTVRLPQRWE